MTITPHQPLAAPIQGKPLYEEYRMDQVRVSDPYIANAFAKEIEYLTSYDPDRLLAGFRENRGLPKRADKYPGWENTEIRGHTLGHYLSALSQAYACTRDDALAFRLNYLLGELALCQHESGYLSAFEERLFDHVENKQPLGSPGIRCTKSSPDSPRPTLPPAAKRPMTSRIRSVTGCTAAQPPGLKRFISVYYRWNTAG